MHTNEKKEIQKMWLCFQYLYFFQIIILHYNRWREILIHHSVVTVTKAPWGTGVSTGAEYLGQTIGELVAVVAQEAVRSKLTAVVSGTPLNAVKTQVAVSRRGTFSTSRTPVSRMAMRWYVGVWVILHNKKFLIELLQNGPCIYLSTLIDCKLITNIYQKHF